ncbi:MAG: hypothetical protein M1829_002564 [Trizodia sp. TS-e1964]|nr:MAG: hypothetical protein M1829_002564 [Trizodia sp. TS-e1964]
MENMPAALTLKKEDERLKKAAAPLETPISRQAAIFEPEQASQAAQQPLAQLAQFAQIAQLLQPKQQPEPAQAAQALQLLRKLVPVLSGATAQHSSNPALVPERLRASMLQRQSSELALERRRSSLQIGEYLNGEPEGDNSPSYKQNRACPVARKSRQIPSPDIADLDEYEQSAMPDLRAYFR